MNPISMSRIFKLTILGFLVIFTSSCKKETENISITDADGNAYDTVKIGAQVWMSENLKTTKYNNGDIIGTSSPSSLDISNETSAKYQWSYDGEESNVPLYGRLYTWYAVTDSRGVCPIGWHVPSQTEWITLTYNLGGEEVAGGKLKETGSSHWVSPNIGAIDAVEFKALPGGYRYPKGSFSGIGERGFWWSATESNTDFALGIFMGYLKTTVENSTYYKEEGFSVRCIKD